MGEGCGRVGVKSREGMFPLSQMLAQVALWFTPQKCSPSSSSDLQEILLTNCRLAIYCVRNVAHENDKTKFRKNESWKWFSLSLTQPRLLDVWRVCTAAIKFSTVPAKIRPRFLRSNFLNSLFTATPYPLKDNRSFNLLLVGRGRFYTD